MLRIDWVWAITAESWPMITPRSQDAFARILLLSLLTSWLGVGALDAASAKWLALGPLLGHVSETDARIWIKASGPARASLRVSQAADLSQARKISGPRLASDTEFAGVITVPGLSPATRYYYRVELDGVPVELPPYTSFTTAPATGSHQHLRFAFVSCSGYEPYDPAPGWADLGTRTNIDLILMLGDNHYGNSPELLKQRAAYRGQRQSVGFREVTRRLPTYAVWDDHDFGPNDSDSNQPLKEQAFRAFLEHWANPSYGEPGNPGVYFKFSHGDIDFFLTDGRYYRNPNTQTNNPAKSMLGRPQVEWLKRSLKASRATVKVLASGGEWQSHGTADSWTSFPKERDEILNFIRDEGIGGVILISGDRHFTAAYQVQKRFIEVTSGPIGGNPSDSRVTPEMIMNHNKGRFYCVYDIDTTQTPPALTLEIYRVGMGLAQRRSFTWDEVTGRQLIPTLPPTPPAPKK